jgi:hypothetical protein
MGIRRRSAFVKLGTRHGRIHRNENSRVNRDQLLEPKQLLTFLKATFFDFGQDDLVQEVESSAHGLHCVSYHFTEYFSTHHRTFSTHQLQQLGRLINDAVSLDDNLENVVSTCLLEHLHQIRAYKALSLYLSNEAKRKTRA